MELEESQRKVVKNMKFQQMQVKRSFDRKARAIDFNMGDIVLKWDILKSRLGHHNKFDHMWAGPFLIAKCKEHNTFQLATMEGDVLPIPINGIHLKPYFEV